MRSVLGAPRSINQEKKMDLDLLYVLLALGAASPYAAQAAYAWMQSHHEI
jgi:hypothetical protein